VTTAINTQPEPKILRRRIERRAVGCLEYAIVAPIAALLVGAIVGGLVFGLLYWAGVPQHWASLAACPAAGLSTLGTLVFGYKDYRRRADIQVVLDAERLSCKYAGKEAALSYADVAGVRLLPRMGCIACVLESQDGQRLALPCEVAPYEAVRDELEWRLMPVLVSRLAKFLDEGETIHLRNSRTAVCRHALFALVGLVASLLSICVIFHAFAGVHGLVHSLRRFGQCRLGLTSGLIITHIPHVGF
jgi:hypothetical protein